MKFKFDRHQILGLGVCGALIASAFACGQGPALTDAPGAESTKPAGEQIAIDGAGAVEATPQIHVMGAPGHDGSNGRNGVDGCKERAPFTASFNVRPLTPTERQETSVLPYLARANDPHHKLKHTVEPLKVGQRTGTIGGMPFVKDSQVLFAIDATSLPPRDAIVEIGSIALLLDLAKSASKSEDKYTRTEVLCFLDERICSGELTTATTWLPTINAAFFTGTPGAPVNQFFGQQYLDREVGRSGHNRIFAGEVLIELEQLLAGSDLSALKMLYGANAADKPVAKRTMRVAVADDTYVSMKSRLVVSLIENTCKTAELKGATQ